jgi:hypothetical protein
MAIKILIMIIDSSFKGTDLSRRPGLGRHGGHGTTAAAMVAANSAEDIVSLIVWYNAYLFLCRNKENTAHNARRRAAMNGQIKIINNN